MLGKFGATFKYTETNLNDGDSIIYCHGLGVAMFYGLIISEHLLIVRRIQRGGIWGEKIFYYSHSYFAILCSVYMVRNEGKNERWLYHFNCWRNFRFSS